MTSDPRAATLKRHHSIAEYQNGPPPPQLRDEALAPDPRNRVHALHPPTTILEQGRAVCARHTKGGQRCTPIHTPHRPDVGRSRVRSEEHTSELKSLMRTSY